MRRSKDHHLLPLDAARRAGLRRLLVRPPQGPALAVLSAAVLAVAVGSVVTYWVPLTAFVPAVLVGALVLRLRPMLVLAAVICGSLVLSVVFRAGDRAVSPSLVVVLAVTVAMALLFARGRDQLGLTGYLGEAMLVELRDRLLAQSELPALPADWHVEGLLRPAHGDAFSGDVLLSSLCSARERLEVALVDVSGKGQDAGSRGLLLSGALGGLLGALPAHEFLPAANRYVLRQNWSEGFATAVHVAVDLTSGKVTVSSAGHPPAIHARAGEAPELLDAASGPLLGVVPEADFPSVTTTLEHGDALLVYSDGVVEQRDVDLGEGIGSLVGRLVALAPADRPGALPGLVDDVAPGEADDRTALLLWRD
ncbi:PP2C family protein-serine/threonine phosphatase [Kineococcus sp. SYSU DK003]|uniref:PP2C family protein-serine/threonine phosphatase n=1 Tax=Kineococcus sp. SYSU DK003 TaxID=3383124 RepID=UPI003D7DF657